MDNTVAAEEYYYYCVLTNTNRDDMTNSTTSEVTKVTVNKIPLTITEFTVADKIYNSQPAICKGVGKAVANNAEVAGLTFTDTWYDINADGSYTERADASVDAGSYKLVIAVDESNETYAGQLEIPFTISKAPVTVKADTNP